MVPERSFGFIREVGAKNEYFFHRRDLTQNRDWPRCIEGCEVSFRADPEHARGPKALNVRVLGQ
jgi:cold shock CspA family protein